MRPLVKYWRGRGLKAIVYLDDGIIAVKGEAEAKAERMAVKRDLELAGLVINVEKCAWEPSHQMEWLGFCIDLTLGEFSVPAQKISALKAKLLEIRQERTLPVKKLASLVGKIISMSPALGAVTRLMTRSLYTILNSRTAWCHQVALIDEALRILPLDYKMSMFSGFLAIRMW